MDILESSGIDVCVIILHNRYIILIQAISFIILCGLLMSSMFVLSFKNREKL